MKSIVAVIFQLLFLNICVFSQPVINSFSPVSGNIGAIVTITGSGFSVTLGNNIVFFGATRANVTAASANSITVVVPVGTTYQPISVTVNGLSGFSSTPFLVTIPDVGTFNNTSYVAALQPFATSLYPQSVSASDIDGDGKADIITPGNYNNPAATFSVLRNTSSPGNVSFAPKADFITGDLAAFATTADIDGDGKPDVIVTSTTNQGICIFRNTSTPGNISFAASVNYITGSNPYSITTADFDTDGRVDIAVANYLSNSVSVFKNLSTPGNILLATKIDLMTALAPRSVVATDIDGDGRPDLAASNEYSNSISVFRNVSTSGAISFAAKVDFTTAAAPYGIASGDLDGDGKNDIAVAAYSAGKISVLRNASTPGNISFFAKTDFDAGSNPENVYIDNADGDTKADMIVASSSSLILQNKSTSGSLSFFYVYIYSARTSMISADVDGDGKPDLIGANVSFSNIYISRNRCNEPNITSLSPGVAASGVTVTINGNNLNNSTAVSFGGVPATSFTIVNSNRIDAVVGTGYSGTVSVTNIYGTGTRPGFVFAGPAIVQDFNPKIGSPGTVVSIKGKNLSSTTVVRFGGVNASSLSIASPDSISAVVGNGATGSVEVVSAYGNDSQPGFTFFPTPIISTFLPLSAATADTVTITGSGFIGVSAVKFGGTPAAFFTTVSTTTIKAVVDAGSNGAISVTTPGGTATRSGFTHLPSITSFSPVTAAKGDTVVITGTAFNSVSQVKFGGSTASYYIVVSPSTIKAVLSTGSSGSVTVTTANGTASLAGFTFIPPPFIQSFTPNLAGAGDTILINGSFFSNATSVTFGGVPAQSYIVNSPASISAVLAAGATGNIQVDTRGGYHVITGFEYTTAPIIRTFSPTKGAVGTTVIISGVNFSSSLSGNTVFFGPVKAHVVSATAIGLVVKVPAGASYERISVSVNNLVAISGKPFLVTYGTSVLTANSFAKHQNYIAGQVPYSLVAADFDGDGKADIAVANYASNTIGIYKNKSIAGTVLFDNAIYIPAGTKPHGMKTADIDGDGKLDLVFLTRSDSGGAPDSVIVFKNISTLGAISFLPVVKAVAALVAGDLVIADISLDGRPDICVVHSAGGYFSGYDYITIHKNISSPGNMAFADLQYYLASGNTSPSSTYYPSSIATGDFNNDGKPDLAVGFNTSNFFSVLTNNSNHGIISLGTWSSGTHFGSGYNNITVCDLNQDGKEDVMTFQYLFKNVVPPSIEQSSNLGAGEKISIADFDGDGKPDYAKINSGSTTPPDLLKLYKNTGSGGGITFVNSANFNSEADPRGICIADFDGDGKPDIATANNGVNSISIFKNRTGEPISLCPDGSTSLISNLAGASYQWQVNSGTGFSDLSNNSTYSGTTLAFLTLNNIPSSFDRYQYRCKVNGISYSEIFTIQFLNTWTGAVSTAWENAGNWSCGAVPDANTDVIITNGNISVNSNITIRSLVITADASLQVTTGNTMTIHR